MGEVVNWSFAMVFSAGILGILVAALLFFFNANSSISSRLLAGFLTCMSLLAFNYVLMKTRFFIEQPYLWRSVAWASFSFQPLGYLYVRSVLQQEYKLKPTDLLFFLPAVTYMFLFMPYFMLSLVEKRSFLETVFKNQNLIVREHENLLPPRWGIWLRIILGVAFTTAQWLLLIKWRGRLTTSGNNNSQNTLSLNWLTQFTIVMTIFWTAVLIEFGMHFSGAAGGNIDYTVIFTISGTIFFICFFLLIRPRILYGMKGWLQEESKPNETTEKQNSQETVTTPTVGKKSAISLSQDQRDKYRAILDQHFRENKPFRKKGYTIRDLSSEIGIPSYLLSFYINQEYGKNFNEFVNDNRVNSLMEEVRNSPDFANYTLEALGKHAGFNSRTAFITAVKRTTGRYPSDIFGNRN
jgi:AraC-like DNA-binding protein